MYWNHSNQIVCSVFKPNEYSWFVSISKKSGRFLKGLFLKDGLVKYDISTGLLFVVSTFSSIYPYGYEIFFKSTDMLAVTATLRVMDCSATFFIL